MNQRKLYIVFFLGFALSFIQICVSAQTVKVAANRNKIFIGEQVKLKFSIEKGKAGINWFQFPDSINHFEIVEKSKIDTVLNGSYTNYYQTISITSFDSGLWEFPSLSLAGINQATNPISINVLPVDVSKMQDYNEIKDIEEVKPENNWLIVGILAAITLISIIVIYWLLKKKKAAVSKPLLKGNLTPLEWALAELNKLNAKNIQTPVEIKRYYSELTNISRTFFSMQLQQHSLQQTTDEWMVNLQPLPVANEIKTAFFQFLRLADTVKFAKYLPPARENEISAEAIKLMLQKVSLLQSDLHSNYQPKLP